MSFAAQKRIISPVVKTCCFFLYVRGKVGVGQDRKKTVCSIPSAIQPVTHSADIPIPDPPKKYEIVKDYVEEEFISPGTSHDPDFEAEDLN
ncbi:hypothetical protein TNCT_497641 [Trichonephila clavata]|uniref:Uncharacterized protein n=1 Tax=Trichonephila clavata TaxID=2740835 RepID=A0A8X6FZZ7_TRICU|nr:hypothetical protein TNCT_497641 [Trichonephila clavata]